MQNINTEKDELDLGPRKNFALAMARKLLKCAEITAAPVSLHRVVEYARRDRNLTIILEKIPGRISGIMVKVRDLDEVSTFIGINTEEPWHRQRYTLGHELGHVFMEHSGCTGDDSYEEREAQIFAAELLMPTAFIKQDLKALRNIPALARLYCVSEHALSIKLKDCRLI